MLSIQLRRLPLARGRVLLLDKPHTTPILEDCIVWQIHPSYCSLEQAMGVIFEIIQPETRASSPKEGQGRKDRSDNRLPIVNVFGALKGRYAKVLVEFWEGRVTPPDSLNCAIVLTARMMPSYFSQPEDAMQCIEGLIDTLPDVGFSDRLSTGRRSEVGRVVRACVHAAYDGNGHQRDAELSNRKLRSVFAAWERKGFSLIDRSTWDRCVCTVQPAKECAWTDEDKSALAYLAKILHVDVHVASHAAGRFLSVLVGHATGEMSVMYVKNMLADCGVKCGHHGKVNEFLGALRQAGWIEQIGGHVVGRRGRKWQIGQRMRHKFLQSPIHTPNPSPYLSLCPIVPDDTVMDVQECEGEGEIISVVGL